MVRCFRKIQVCSFAFVPHHSAAVLGLLFKHTETYLNFFLVSSSFPSSTVLSRGSSASHGKALARLSEELFWCSESSEINFIVVVWICARVRALKACLEEGARKPVSLRSACNVTLRKKWLKLWVRKLSPAVCFLLCSRKQRIIYM